jgi:hypothetical protein
MVVPNDVEVPAGPHRRHIGSLADVDVEALTAIHDQLSSARDAAYSDRG